MIARDRVAYTCFYLIHILFQKADMVVAPFSIQSNREKVIDFAHPYYMEYTVILMKNQDPSQTKWRTLIEPFDDKVLICIGMALPVASLLLYLFEKFSPFYTEIGGENSDRSGLHTYQDAFWYMYGALLTQGKMPLL